MGISLGHLLIAALVILLFGPKRLPELASALGKSMRAFREAMESKGGEPEKLAKQDDAKRGNHEGNSS